MNDFSSDYILDQYAKLNEISWRDNDVCEVCGMRFDEVGDDCIIPKCPIEINDNSYEEDDK